MTSDRLLTVPEAARLCSISASRMYHIVSGRELPVYKIGRSVRIRPTDLEDYLSGKRRYSRNEILRMASARAASATGTTSRDRGPGQGRESLKTRADKKHLIWEI